MFNEGLEGRFHFYILVIPFLVVRADLETGEGVGALHRRLFDARVIGLGCAVRKIQDHRLLGFRIAEVVAVGCDQVGGVGVVSEERDVAHFPPIPLADNSVNDAIEERGVGLRFDGHPFGGDCTGDGEMRLYLHPLHATHPGVRMAPDAGYAGGGIAVVPAG